MSVLINDMSLNQYVDFMKKACGKECIQLNENKQLTLMGCDIIEVKAIQIDIENDFRYFGRRIVYACYPMRRGGDE